MKKFILKLLIFLMFLTISDYILGAVLKELFFTYSTRGNQKVIYTIKQANADVYFFGSSRAYHTYVSSIFSDSLNLKCANVGRDGQLIYYHYAILNVLLKRSTPKIAVFELVTNDYIKVDKKDDFDRLSVLLPFYDEYPELEEVIYKRGPSEKYKLLSKSYPYNSLIFNITRSMLDRTQNLTFDGYEPLYGVYGQKIRNIDKEIETEDDEKFSILEKIFQKLKDINCDIYVIRSPVFAIDNNPTINLRFKNLMNKCSVEFLDYQSDSVILSHPEWFYDVGHLNHAGATYFSGEIAHQIKIRREGK